MVVFQYPSACNRIVLTNQSNEQLWLSESHAFPPYILQSMVFPPAELVDILNFLRTRSSNSEHIFLF